MIRRAILMVTAVAAALVAAAGASADTQVRAAAACTTNDVSLGFDGQENTAGTRVEQFSYEKVGSGRCSMKGFAKVELLRKSGAAYSIKVRRSHQRPVKTVGLRKGKAIAFELTHPNAEPGSGKTCKNRVHGFRVKAPGIENPLTLKLSSPIHFCEKGAKRTALHRKR